jgi:hypothetical protein
VEHTTGLLAPRHVLHGRYRILGPVGKGGMGAVYRAQDDRSGGRVVAVKELSQSGLDPEELTAAIATFKHEATLLASLKHPCLPKIYNDFTEAGRQYLVMEFIEGETLEQRLRRSNGQHLPVSDVLKIGEQLCSVLGYLHRQRPPIIFRDLKPSNVMLTPRGQMYLIDFGIARLFKPGQRHDTVSFGSPGYAAPEQYGKSQTTVRSDVYSLGATLHQLLTGIDPSVRPFEFVPVRPRNPQVPPELDLLINRMVQMNDRMRPESMVTVERELRAIDARMHVGRAQQWSQLPVPPRRGVAPRRRVAAQRRWALPRLVTTLRGKLVRASTPAMATPVLVRHVMTPAPPVKEMRRSKRSVLVLSLISIACFMLSVVTLSTGLVEFLDPNGRGWHFLGVWGWSALALVAGVAVWFVAWVISMVRTASVARWGWFLAMLVLGILLGPFAVLWYGLFGPVARKA